MFDLSTLLSNSYFKNFGIPFIAIVITTGVKVISRKDHSLGFTRNDLAIGFNLLVSGIVVILNYSIKLAERVRLSSGTQNQTGELLKLSNLVILIFIYCISAVILSTLIRRYGWQKPDEKELNTVWGIFVPLLVGTVFLIVAVNYANN